MTEHLPVFGRPLGKFVRTAHSENKKAKGKTPTPVANLGEKTDVPYRQLNSDLRKLHVDLAQ